MDWQREEPPECKAWGKLANSHAEVYLEKCLSLQVPAGAQMLSPSSWEGWGSQAQVQASLLVSSMKS